MEKLSLSEREDFSSKGEFAKKSGEVWNGVEKTFVAFLQTRRQRLLRVDAKFGAAVFVVSRFVVTGVGGFLVTKGDG